MIDSKDIRRKEGSSILSKQPIVKKVYRNHSRSKTRKKSNHIIHISVRPLNSVCPIADKSTISLKSHIRFVSF